MEDWNESVIENNNSREKIIPHFESGNKEKEELKNKLETLYPNDAHLSGIGFQYLADKDWILLKDFLTLINEVENIKINNIETVRNNIIKIEEQRLKIKNDLEEIREYEAIDTNKITGNYHFSKAEEYSEIENQYFSRGNFLGLIINKIWPLDYELAEKYPENYKSIYNN